MAADELQRTEGKGFVAFVSVELVSHSHINGADKAKEEGMEVFAGGEARGDGGFREKVKDKAVWHG